MESLRRSWAFLFALSISLSTSIAHPRHKDRTHEHEYAPRQEILPAPFAGTQTSSITKVPYPIEVLPTMPLMPGSIVTSAPLSAATIDPGDNLPSASIANAARIFPTTVLQIPVLTICPANQSIPLPVPHTNSPINTATPLNGTNSSGSILNTTSSFTNATGYLPMHANVGAAFPTATLADPNARIVLDDNGCETLFSPVTTAICNTALSMAAQLPISVTDCGQWVTFSSSAVCGGDRMTAFFLAPWYDIASGAVPATVQVQTCPSLGADGSNSSSCVTGTESWSVSTATVQSAVVETAKFYGEAAGPLNLILIPNLLTTSIPSSSTTTLSIDTTVTHLSPQAVPTILRLRQDPVSDSTSSVENTVTRTIQLPDVTQTYQLEAITHHTTVTVTVERTMTSVVVVRGSTTEALKNVQTRQA